MHSSDDGPPLGALMVAAQTIDALFAPLPTVESRGRAWLFVDHQLKSVNLRLGITDGTNTETGRVLSARFTSTGPVLVLDTGAAARETPRATR
jgi:hypothetical protein